MSVAAKPMTRSSREAGKARRLAEWVTLILSVLIVAGLAGYLVQQGMVGDPETVPITAVPDVDGVQRLGEAFVLPIEVKNSGRKSLKGLQLEVSSPDGTTVDVQIDYLGQHSTQTVYTIVKSDPRQAPVQVQPRVYTLE
jgi:uncharacterized protein (TIGR02588 family)